MCSQMSETETNNKDTVMPMQMTKKQKAKLNITFAFSAGFYMSCRFLFLFFGNYSLFFTIQMEFMQKFNKEDL